MKTIQSFIEQPVFIGGICWITNGKTNHGEFNVQSLHTKRHFYNYLDEELISFPQHGKI